MTCQFKTSIVINLQEIFCRILVNLFHLQYYLVRQDEPHNRVYGPWDQYPEISTMPTVRAQVVQLIPYLSNKQFYDCNIKTFWF